MNIMDVRTGFFYLFSAVMLFAAVRMITARNPVHAVLYLMLAFSQAAGCWMLLEAEFLAIALVLVYLGAVMVLFLFVVMMLDIQIEKPEHDVWRRYLLAIIIGILLVLGITTVLGRNFTTAAISLPRVELAASNSNTSALGLLLYTEYLYPVEIAAVLLLIAMVAAIALTLRRRHDRWHIPTDEQIRVKPKERLRMVQLETVVREGIEVQQRAAERRNVEQGDEK